MARRGLARRGKAKKKTKKGDDRMKITEFIKDKDFSSAGSEAKPFPEGKTKINLNKVDVEEKIVEFEGKPKTRYLLSTEGEVYWAGSQIMEGIKQATENGFTTVTITRKGQGLATKYGVMPIQEPAQEGDL